MLNGAILEEILRIFIPVSKVNNLSFWKQWGIPCFAFVEPRIFQSFPINIISFSCLGQPWVVAKDKQYHLHFTFFRLYPFVFLLNSGWVLSLHARQSKTNAGPAFKRFTVQWGRETQKCIVSRMWASARGDVWDLKRVVWFCQVEKRGKEIPGRWVSNLSEKSEPSGVSGSRGEWRWRAKDEKPDWNGRLSPDHRAKKALPRSLDFILWAMRKPLWVLSRGRCCDQIYELTRLFQLLGGIGRDWEDFRDIPKIDSTGLGALLEVGGKGQVRDGLRWAGRALLQDRKPIRKQEAGKLSSLPKVIQITWRQTQARNLTFFPVETPLFPRY